ncbi:MAG: MerR family transcriptional regulator [bacterium]|nr:MerR family transcriptional regulator [bacterium]
MGQTAPTIPEKLYFKIGEVCDLVGVQAHVLRYWETEFPQLSPQKNRSGQRSYRRRDVEISLRIKELLYDDMYTIAGARKKLQTELREPPKLKIVHPEPQPQSSEEKDSPGLFDEDLHIDEIHDASEAIYSHTSRGNDEQFSPEQVEAIRSLSNQLLELREMLKNRQ